jgi:ketosteroid isomerase-like protein
MQENVEIARASLEAFNREGIAATARFIREDLEVHPFPEWPGPDVYRGMEGLTQLVEEWTENFDDYRWEPQRFVDAGSRVVVLARHLGETKDQRVTVDQPVSGVFSFDDDLKIVRMDYFLTWHEALEAVGLPG